MTFEQLSLFVAVAEREHLTRAAEAVRLTPSAVSAAIRNLEAYYGVALFHRVGRRIELTQAGRLFLPEARATLARAQSAAHMLSDLGSLRRGQLTIYASQTLSSYWLPPVLARFQGLYPGVEVSLTTGNTQGVAEAVRDGQAEMGFIEGRIDMPALSVTSVARDALIVVVSPAHPWADGRGLRLSDLSDTRWVLRESGSGTRAEFEAALSVQGGSVSGLEVWLTLPSNEAVLSAVRAGGTATVVSALAAEPFLALGAAVRANFPLPERHFSLLRHKERHQGRAAQALEALCLSPVSPETS
ncbi:MAG: LysR substrate-binding domain-containing protein [Asticcacaulis sp.]